MLCPKLQMTFLSFILRSMFSDTFAPYNSVNTIANVMCLQLGLIINAHYWLLCLLYNQRCFHCWEIKVFETVHIRKTEIKCCFNNIYIFPLLQMYHQNMPCNSALVFKAELLIHLAVYKQLWMVYKKSKILLCKVYFSVSIKVI